jgi:hypothetical protein
MIGAGEPSSPVPSCSCLHPMAHLWRHDDGNDRWDPTPLDADSTIAGGAAHFVEAHAPDGACWVVLGDDTVHVNGSALGAGVAVLADRDEIRVGAERVFFSTERLAAVTIHPGDERAVFCPRCKLEIAAGSPVVRCPSCNVLHHQSDEYPCWTYGEHCALGDQPTAMDAGFRWTPGDL